MNEQQKYRIRMKKAELNYGRLKYKLVAKSGFWIKNEKKETFIYNNFPMEFVQKATSIYFKKLIKKDLDIDVELVTIQ